MAVTPGPPGGPLDGLYGRYRELTAKVESGVFGIDEALAQLQAEEVVDAAGDTWRIDPMSRSFIRRAPGGGMPWRPADPAEFAVVPPPGQVAADAAPPPAGRPGAGPSGPGRLPDGRGAGRNRRRRITALGVLAVAGGACAIALLGHGHGRGAPSRHAAAVPSTPAAPAPTVTRQAPPLSSADLSRYRPTGVKAAAAPRQIVLTWALSDDARRDGAGIIVRQQPADQGGGVTGLSRSNAGLPETYVAVPLTTGRRYCFLVGVLLQGADGGPALAQSEPVCAVPG